MGILLFTEMKKVFPINEFVLERAKKWLLERRDGKGSFFPNNSKVNMNNFNFLELSIWWIFSRVCKSCIHCLGIV
jgi:hypothetical protein